ncbi:MAG: Gfo/Idh/MocA family oxidoreductase, partial [Verrucomicrobiae bacterium]|nr:Gfo/Idh/MocA family oxidoreductase [Verrucomicrobiae bacterium]
MQKIRVGIAGFGFIGPHHLDAIRRLGIAEVTAIATSSQRDAKAKAKQYGIEKAYGDWRLLVDDPDLDVIDVATPTNLHAPIALATIKAGKHILVDKPMALTTSEARQMLKAAERAGVVHAVTFNIRYNVMLQHARALIGKGKLGETRFIRGHYLQEWLLKETDYNWRIEPDRGGALAMVADAGAHWYDLAQHLTGQRIVRVLADFSTFIDTRRKPAEKGKTRPFEVTVPDLGMVMCEFENSARGLFSVSALTAGHKNDLTIEINGA